MSKIIITGAAGFIGSNLAEALNKKGEDNLILVDHLGESLKWKNILSLKFLDYFDKDEFLPLLEKDYFGNIKAIFHLGACSDTTVKDLNYLLQNNYRYSQRIAIYALKKG